MIIFVKYIKYLQINVWITKNLFNALSLIGVSILGDVV